MAASNSSAGNSSERGAASLHQQQLSSTESVAITEQALSDGSITPNELTPTSSASRSPRVSHGHFDPSHPACPLNSIEHGVGILALEDPDTVVPSSDTPASPTASIANHLGEIRLDESGPVLPEHRASLSPAPRNHDSSRTGFRRRSAPRNPAPRHEVDQETPPNSAFYRHDFQHALTRSRSLARQITDALSSSDLHTDETSAICELYKQARDASEYSGPQEWRIGFVGDSGAGKSSLINSLLDIKDLARASSAGEACTCTATEYHYHDSSTYNVEVVYFSKSQVLDQFTQLLGSYRQFHLDTSETARNSPNREQLQEESSAAWDTLKAAFRNQRLLTEAYLLDENEQMIIDSLSSWIDHSPSQAHNQLPGQQNTRRESANDREAFKTLLGELTSAATNPNIPASWPYIERVNVFLRANILSKGLILVDLPGLRDTNSSRKQITERYIRNCNEVFAIANIGRAITDAGVAAVVRLAERTRRSHVGIVCTKSDDTEAGEAERDWFGLADGQTLRRLNTELAARENTLQEIEAELEENLTPQERLEEFERKNETEKERDKLEYERDKHLIETRNRKIARAVIATYSGRIQNVFCVSNKVYWKHREKVCSAASPWLTLSGIIGLRKHCLGLVADHQLRDASSFMRDLMPNLVTSIDLWVQSGSGHIGAETRTRIREAAAQVETTLYPELRDVLSQSNQIVTPLMTQFNGRWHHMTYAAFCRNDGDHVTAATVRRRCWNEEIIAGMSGDMYRHWEGLRSHANEMLRGRSTAMDQFLMQALGPLRAIAFPAVQREEADSVQTLITTLLQRKVLLCAEILRIVEEYERALSQLGNADFLSGIRTSFVGQHMDPAYQQAKHDYGTGVDRRRKNLIANTVRHQELFRQIQNKVAAKFQDLTLQAEQQVQAANRTHFSAMRVALDTLRNENAAMEAERNPVFRQRLRTEVSDAQGALRDIAAVVEAAQATPARV